MNLEQWFDDIDIYLFDQLLKNRIDRKNPILDAGCGSGRNVVYLLKDGYPVYAVDHSEDAVRQVREPASELARDLPGEHFKVAPVEDLPFDDEFFGTVVSSAVLHFSQNPTHFEEMLDEMWRVLKPGGIFFCRLASKIGIEDRVEPLENGYYLLPTGTKWFLVDYDILRRQQKRLGADQIEPIKTTNVEDRRAMTTWVLRK